MQLNRRRWVLVRPTGAADSRWKLKYSCDLVCKSRSVLLFCRVQSLTVSWWTVELDWESQRSRRVHVAAIKCVSPLPVIVCGGATCKQTSPFNSIEGVLILLLPQLITAEVVKNDSPAQGAQSVGQSRMNESVERRNWNR